MGRNRVKTNYIDTYAKILKLVKIGITIENACIATKVNRNTFRENITKEQKAELRFHKTTTLIHGVGGHWGRKDFMTIEIEEDFK